VLFLVSSGWDATDGTYFSVRVIIDAVIAAGVQVFLRSWGYCGFIASLVVVRSVQRLRRKRVSTGVVDSAVILLFSALAVSRGSA